MADPRIFLLEVFRSKAFGDQMISVEEVFVQLDGECSAKRLEIFRKLCDEFELLVS